MEWYHELRAKLSTRELDGPVRSIMFTGTSHRDDASVLAADYAAILSDDSRQMVLLIDLKEEASSHNEASEIDRAHVFTDNHSDKGNRPVHAKKIGPGNLYLLSLGSNYSESIDLFEPARLDRLLQIINKKFDYLIIASPVFSSSQARIISVKVDGVVLVILSGKTRRQIVMKAKEAIEAAGGKLFGIVLNRRKYYIPQWIYKRL